MTDYTLYYWPIPFRGHFIRYVLAHVGATWEEAPVEHLQELKAMDSAAQPHPFMAPPLLVERQSGAATSQMPAILGWLAARHGLASAPALDMRLACDASDILLEITRCHGAQMWEQETWDEFAGARLPRWMQIHERIVRSAGVAPGAGFLHGDGGPGLGDLVLGALWHTMADRLPPLRALLTRHAPAVEGLADRVASGAQVATMLGRWESRRPTYCGGEIEVSLLTVLGMVNA